MSNCLPSCFALDRHSPVGLSFDAAIALTRLSPNVRRPAVDCLILLDWQAIQGLRRRLRSQELNGGRAPFRRLANRCPAALPARRSTTDWTPQGPGFQTLTVIDAAGRAASVKVFVE